MGDAGMGRREALLAMGFGLAAGIAGADAAQAQKTSAAGAGATPNLPAGADNLANLVTRLEQAPRRRDFKTVPMILDRKDLWDHEALDLVLAYRGEPKQIWNNADLAGPWLDHMRHSLNVQVFSWRHPNFLIVSATHGSAHLALLDQAIWDKYKLAKIAGDKYPANGWIVEKAGASADPSDAQNDNGVFLAKNPSIPALQRRGAIFLGCHDTLWELAGKLVAGGANPDKLSREALAAELTNHLIPGVVLTPGIAGTLPEFQLGGFYYAQ
jgi:hypothetical protein